MTASPRLTPAAQRCATALPRGRRCLWALKSLARLAGASALAWALFFMPDPAQAVSDDPVLRRMDAVLEENARLRDEAWKARKNGREAAQQAEEAANASDERLERTRVEALAHVAGVSPAQVESLRKDGKSWGQAAGELGVHPGFLGIGKAPLYQSLPKSKAPSTKLKAKTGKKGAKQLKAKGKGKTGGKKISPAKKTAKKSSKAAPVKKTKTVKKAKKSKPKS
ncbi:MAG: hypothetical protein AB7E46_10130 [Desulfovibrio sp.]